MTENEIQRAVFAHIKTRGAQGVFAFHPMNGGIHQRGRRRGINSGLGVYAGVPDVIAIKGGQVFALELKTDTGRPSEAQLLAVENIRNAGGFAAICYGLDRALACLETWGILKGKAA